jgi:NADP-dependent 3-hydroxy acid dehydrogenase YdfG
MLFNNAGVAGGGSFVTGSRDECDRRFAVSWFGVCYGTRAFLPLLIATDQGVVVNTSSVNGMQPACDQAQRTPPTPPRSSKYGDSPSL